MFKRPDGLVIVAEKLLAQKFNSLLNVSERPVIACSKVGLKASLNNSRVVRQMVWPVIERLVPVAVRRSELRPRP